jgi:hypothetical protein
METGDDLLVTLIPGNCLLVCQIRESVGRIYNRPPASKIELDRFQDRDRVPTSNLTTCKESRLSFRPGWRHLGIQGNYRSDL